MSDFITIRLEERWVTCFMCGVDDDQTNPADRRGVPIWNGEPASSKATDVDGYMATCARCYLRWDRWDNALRGDSNGK